MVWAAVIGGLGYAAGRGVSALGLQPWMFGGWAVGLFVAAIAGTLYEKLRFERSGPPLRRPPLRTGRARRR